jgi:hypothetical protein
MTLSDTDRPATGDGAGGGFPGSARRMSEGSMLGRFVVLLPPLFAIAAAWIASVVAGHVPGGRRPWSRRG